MATETSSIKENGGGIHVWIARGALLLSGWFALVAVFNGANAAVGTDLDSGMWHISSLSLTPLFLLFPLALYGIIGANVVRYGKGRGSLQLLATYATSKAAAIVIAGVTLGMLSWVTLIFVGFNLGGAEKRHGKFYTTNHGTVTGEVTEEEYILSHWLTRAAGGGVGVAFSSFGLAMALVLAERKHDVYRNPPGSSAVPLSLRSAAPAAKITSPTQD